MKSWLLDKDGPDQRLTTIQFPLLSLHPPNVISYTMLLYIAYNHWIDVYKVAL